MGALIGWRARALGGNTSSTSERERVPASRRCGDENEGPSLPSLVMRHPFIVLGLLALSACGGGGGGSSSSPGTGGGGADNSWLSFSPTTNEVTTHTGESAPFTIKAVSSKVIDGVINVGVIDSRGVISPEIDLRHPSAMTYTAGLKVAPTLATGIYEGSFEVRLCRDVPTTCAQPIAGSPWQVPYKITVRPATNLTALTSLPGAAGWSTYQGDAMHTGFVDATVSAENFNRRWVRGISTASIATDATRVFVNASNSVAGPLRALNEHDGSDLWTTSRSSVLSGPASSGGKVWTVALDANGRGPELWAVDAATGATLSGVQFYNSSFPSLRFAPVPAGASVFFAADSGTTIGRRRQSDGAAEWLTNFGPSPSVDAWTPTIGGGLAMVFDLGTLHVTDLATATKNFSIVGPRPLSGSSVWAPFGAPSLGANGIAYATAYNAQSSTPSGQLAAFDLNTRSLRWTGSLNTVRSNPVLARGVVYVTLASRTLQALDAATGTELWRWDVPQPPADPNAPASAPGPYGPNAPLLVVGDYAFMGVDQVTYAVDLRTHQLAWQYPLSGPLAVSANGVLYIASDQNVVDISARKLVAINLR
ncbi:PQQ-binding-like beta-propeller repeat protein [Roseateles sp.]|uniref:outer membrane protein assembly factor BamB family protein n=1 Tax=Roseateles sp. TaxID=1971397 RepID=UPI0032657B55